jgi:hypothetical protein
LPENWKHVAKDTRYEVSDLGNVRFRGQPIIPGIRKDGYPMVSPGLVHRLVLTAFEGPPNGRVCRHLDGTRTNNNLSNLKWGTYKDNHDDSKQHGTASKPPARPQVGELNNSAKLTREQVARIRERKEAAKALAAELGITQWTVFDIRKGRSWTEGIA